MQVRNMQSDIILGILDHAGLQNVGALTDSVKMLLRVNISRRMNMSCIISYYT